MKILHLCNVSAGDNRDEDAIAHAFVQLGHEVVQAHEKAKHRKGIDLHSIRADFCLFHKCEDYGALESLRMPKVAWFFDLVDSDDPTLAPRCRHRRGWVERITKLSLLVFMTDGDWVARDTTGKLHHLMQGADERYLGLGEPLFPETTPILFTGMVNHGRKRASHIDHLKEKWGDRFSVIGDGGPKYRRHGRELADLFASTKIVVAPDGPVTDLYTSNRAFLTLGLGGFLLHPKCGVMEKHYRRDEDLIYYDDREELDFLIERFLDPSGDWARRAWRENGLKATRERNLYRHRCVELIEKVKERL